MTVTISSSSTRAASRRRGSVLFLAAARTRERPRRSRPSRPLRRHRQEHRRKRNKEPRRNESVETSVVAPGDPPGSAVDGRVGRAVRRRAGEQSRADARAKRIQLAATQLVTQEMYDKYRSGMLTSRIELLDRSLATSTVTRRWATGEGWKPARTSSSTARTARAPRSSRPARTSSSTSGRDASSTS